MIRRQFFSWTLTGKTYRRAELNFSGEIGQASLDRHGGWPKFGFSWAILKKERLTPLLTNYTKENFVLHIQNWINMHLWG